MSRRWLRSATWPQSGDEVSTTAR